MGISFFYLILSVLYTSLGLSLAIFSAIKRKKGNQYLSIILLLHVVYLLPIALQKYGYNINWSTWTTGPVRISIVPLTYLYLKKLFVKEKGITTKDLWHFIPTLLDMVLTILVAYNHAADVVNNGNFNIQQAMQSFWNGNFYYNLLAIPARSIIFLQSIYYFFRTLPIIKNCLTAQKNENSFIDRELLIWLRIFAYAFIVLGINDGAAIFGAYSYPPLILIITILRAFFSIFAFTFAIHYSNVNSKVCFNSVNELADTISTKVENSSKNYANWKNTFIKKQLHLDKDLTLYKTSTALKIPKYKVSQLIREEGYSSFYLFVNTLRIEESKKLLLDKPDNHIIETVLNHSGFKSRATFFRVFKSIVGCTPGEFINNN